MFVHNNTVTATPCEPGVSRKVMAYNDQVISHYLAGNTWLTWCSSYRIVVYKHNETSVNCKF